jgi:hypothetical protein
MRAKGLIPLAVGLLVVCGAGRVWSQSLGDVAKKEEERRKHVQPAGKVYTNKDLGAVPPATPPPATGSAAPEEKTGAAASKPEAATGGKDDQSATGKDAAKGGDAKGQAYWAGRRKSLQEALDRDQTFADAMQSRINALTTDFVNRDDPAQRSTIERDRQKAVAELDRLRKQIAADRKAIDDLEDEARRAGVPPGWLR